MKKRLIAIIAALAVAVTALVAFAGCQSVSPQRLLLNSRPWESVDTEEYFVYDVVYSPSEGETVNGSYTVAVKGYAAGSSLTVGDFTYENPCFYVHAELTLDNGDYIITDSVVDPNIVALYGSEEKSERGTLTKYTARYDDGDCNYSYSVQNEGEEATISEGTIGMGDCCLELPLRAGKAFHSPEAVMLFGENRQNISFCSSSFAVSGYVGPITKQEKVSLY